MSFQCPDCKRVSHHPKDEENRYCGACNKVFSEDEIARKEVLFDYETFDGFYRIERNYFCETKQRRYFDAVSPDQIINLIEAGEEIRKLLIVHIDANVSIADTMKLHAAIRRFDDALACNKVAQ